MFAFETVLNAMGALLASVAIFAIGGSLISGLQDNDQRSLRSWRLIKLLSALGGVIGLALLGLNLFEVVRESTYGHSVREAEEEVLESRFQIAAERAVTCSDTAVLESRLKCINMRFI